MKIKSKYVVAITLIVATLFMGVLSVEKTILQTGTNTGYDGGSWTTRSREPDTTNEASEHSGSLGTNGSEPGLLEEGSSIPTQQSNGILLHDPSLTEESEDVESNSPSALGAGYASNVKVRPGYRYYTAEELEKGLLYDLVPLADYFIEAQETYGIDAIFLAAVAAEESGWGRYKFRKNNIFGFENCDFDSLEHCVDHAASWLKTQYLTPGGTYYEGAGVADINKHYNGRDTWEQHVVAIMGQIVDRIERTDTE